MGIQYNWMIADWSSRVLFALWGSPCWFWFTIFPVETGMGMFMCWNLLACYYDLQWSDSFIELLLPTQLSQESCDSALLLEFVYISFAPSINVIGMPTIWSYIWEAYK